MEELTPLQHININNSVKSLYRTEKIVDHNLDVSRWKIKNIYKDTIWVQLLDEPDADAIMRNGIVIPTSQTRPPFRFGKVIMCGDETKYAKVGEIVRFPYGIGQPYDQTYGGYKTWMLREDSVIAVVEFDGNDAELQQHLTNDIHLAGR